MKKTLVLLLCLAFAFAASRAARAGDREWATAGKILTGVVGASILADALDNGYSSGGYYSHPAHGGYRYAAPVATPYYETARPVYYNSRSLAPYPMYEDRYPRHPAATTYYEEEYSEPVTYRRKTITRTY